MSAPSGVCRDQHIAGSEDERLAVAGGELQRPQECKHILRLGRIVPVERRMRRRLLEVRSYVAATISFLYWRRP